MNRPNNLYINNNNSLSSNNSFLDLISRPGGLIFYLNKYLSFARLTLQGFLFWLI